jgi:hypothetical protein
MQRKNVLAVLNDQLARQLLESNNPVRLAYTGVDGFPRVVPLGFHWNSQQFVICTIPGAPKIRALETNPKVAMTIDSTAFPPKVLLVRGTQERLRHRVGRFLGQKVAAVERLSVDPRCDPAPCGKHLCRIGELVGPPKSEHRAADFVSGCEIRVVVQPIGGPAGAIVGATGRDDAGFCVRRLVRVERFGEKAGEIGASGPTGMSGAHLALRIRCVQLLWQ